mmetsp:Transcript_4239/g.13286  ORF Transcript_4239/g.13286 Transcript_4239/m.13286 type:complete len:130 (+) Transcript_4239:1353-1742(+)
MAPCDGLSAPRDALSGAATRFRVPALLELPGSFGPSPRLPLLRRRVRVEDDEHKGRAARCDTAGAAQRGVRRQSGQQTDPPPHAPPLALELRKACRQNRADVARRCVERGAAVDDKNTLGETASASRAN